MSTPIKIIQRTQGDKERLYAQACRDAAFIFERLKRLPWEYSKQELLSKLLTASEGLQANITALAEKERPERDPELRPLDPERDIEELVSAVADAFPSFGGGRDKGITGNPLDIWLKDYPACFAACVDIRDVVVFIVDQHGSRRRFSERAATSRNEKDEQEKGSHV